MTSLLPDVIRDAISSESIYHASESYGVVALVLLLVMLLHRDIAGASGEPALRQTTRSAFITPLVLVVLLTIGLRVAALF